MPERAYLFDTGALIDIYRGRQRIAAYFETLARQMGYLSVISEAELWMGLRPNETAQHEALLRYFVSLPVNSFIARQAGEWMQRYRSRGLGWVDALIAATARDEGVAVLTRDRRLAALLAQEADFVVYDMID